MAPGGGYGPDGPLLMFARVAVENRGGITQAVAWDFSNAPEDAQQRQQVVAQVEAAAAVLGTVITAVEHFLDEVVWP